MRKTPSRPEAFHEALRELKGYQAQGAVSRFELYFARSRSTKIDSKDLKVDSLTRSEDVGLSVRVSTETPDGPRTGFSFTTSLAPEAVRHAVKQAVQVARIMPADLLTTIGNFSRDVRPIEDGYDQAGLEVSIEQKIDLAKRLEDACRKSDSRIKGVRAAAFTETAYEAHLLNSEDQHLVNEGTRFSVNITCKAEENGDAQIGSDHAFSSHLNKLNIDDVARLAAEEAVELLGAKMPPTMQCPGIIRNGVVADLLEFLASSFSGEEIDKGRSMLGGKLGEKCFSDKVTIVDDGTLKDGYATRPFDAEGTRSQRTAVVEKGVFASMLLDQYYAKKLKSTSTGNSSRSIKAPPTVSLTNFYMEAGKKSFDELLKQAGNGILITNLMGVHTANAVTGAFSLGASGILIENGKLGRPVKGFAVAGNVIDLFKDLTEIGSDIKFYGNIGAPSLLIPNLAISGE